MAVGLEVPLLQNTFNMQKPLRRHEHQASSISVDCSPYLWRHASHTAVHPTHCCPWMPGCCVGLQLSSCHMCMWPGSPCSPACILQAAAPLLQD